MLLPFQCEYRSRRTIIILSVGFTVRQWHSAFECHFGRLSNVNKPVSCLAVPRRSLTSRVLAKMLRSPLSRFSMLGILSTRGSMAKEGKKRKMTKVAERHRCNRKVEDGRVAATFLVESTMTRRRNALLHRILLSLLETIINASCYCCFFSFVRKDEYFA